MKSITWDGSDDPTKIKWGGVLASPFYFARGDGESRPHGRRPAGERIKHGRHESAPSTLARGTTELDFRRYYRA